MTPSCATRRIQLPTTSSRMGAGPVPPRVDPTPWPRDNLSQTERTGRRRQPPTPADAEAPTALLLSLPFWFCDCGRRPAARKATACTGSCTWWHTRSPASRISPSGCSPRARLADSAAHEQRSRVDFSSPATVLQRQGRPTYSEPSIPWHTGHTKSVNNRLRTQRRNRNHWTNLRQAPVMKPRQPPAPSPTRAFDAGLPAPAEYVPEAGRPPTRGAAQSTESR